MIHTITETYIDYDDYPVGTTVLAVLDDRDPEQAVLFERFQEARSRRWSTSRNGQRTSVQVRSTETGETADRFWEFIS